MRPEAPGNRPADAEAATGGAGIETRPITRKSAPRVSSGSTSADRQPPAVRASRPSSAGTKVPTALAPRLASTSARSLRRPWRSASTTELTAPTSVDPVPSTSAASRVTRTAWPAMKSRAPTPVVAAAIQKRRCRPSRRARGWRVSPASTEPTDQRVEWRLVSV